MLLLLRDCSHPPLDVERRRAHKKGVSGLLMRWIAMMFHSTGHHN
jgi:hypothetical protein